LDLFVYFIFWADHNWTEDVCFKKTVILREVVTNPPVILRSPKGDVRIQSLFVLIIYKKNWILTVGARASLADDVGAGTRHPQDDDRGIIRYA